MRTNSKVATWLDIVAAPHTHGQKLEMRVHPIRECRGHTVSDGPCYAISLNGRWLCSSDGNLTVLRGSDAVDRFMQLVRMPHFERGTPASLKVDCGKNAHCIAMGPDRSLHGCAMSSTDAH